jgi:hypothetical protein
MDTFPLRDSDVRSKLWQLLQYVAAVAAPTRQAAWSMLSLNRVRSSTSFGLPDAFRTPETRTAARRARNSDTTWIRSNPTDGE